MARPERFELPTYGFVDAANRTGTIGKSTRCKQAAAYMPFRPLFYRVLFRTIFSTTKRVGQLLHRGLRLRRVGLYIVLARDRNVAVSKDLLNNFVRHVE